MGVFAGSTHRGAGLRRTEGEPRCIGGVLEVLGLYVLKVLLREDPVVAGFIEVRRELREPGVAAAEDEVSHRALVGESINIGGDLAQERLELLAVGRDFLVGISQRGQIAA